jgi:hypothetical protein
MEMDREKGITSGELRTGATGSAVNEGGPNHQVFAETIGEDLHESLVEPVVPLHAIEKTLQKFLGDREDADEVIAAILKDLTPGD